MVTTTATHELNEESVMKLMDLAEQEIKLCYSRLETMERNLQFRPMTMEERETMEKDVQQLKDTLKMQEDNLKKLRGENRSSAMLAVIIVVGTFLFYIFYSIIFQKPSASFRN